MRSNPLMRGLAPAHPGEILREDIVPALGRSKSEIARLLGVSRQQFHDILEEKKPVTVPMALRIGKLCGNGPNLWIALQREFDLDIAIRNMAAEIEAIPTLEAVDA